MWTIRHALLCATALTAVRPPRRGLRAGFGVLLGLSGALLPAGAHANPDGGAVVGGQAAISTPDSRTLRIDQGSANAIINWRSFDIGPSETVQIQQPSAGSALLNRVTGSQAASRLLGRLTANGQVMLVNPNGVMIGRDAVIDVGALVATTADIPDAAFMAGRRAFSIPGNPGAAVINAGAITVRDGGLAALVAPGVENSGVIVARLGRVALASGDTATLDFYGDGLVEVAADPAVLREVRDAEGRTLDAAVSNSGRILADGGRVWLTAAAGARLLDTAINVQGLVQADSVDSRAGEIVLTASGAGGVEIAGTLHARGTASAGAGGRVRAAGSRVIQRGPIDVSGTPGGRGGEIALSADGLVAIGNRLAADGGRGGGIAVTGGAISSAGRVTATGSAAGGGRIALAAAGSVIEPAAALLDASGAGDGGTIRVVAGQQVTTSGSYRAVGQGGRGGRIDLTAPAVKLLSPQLSAAGAAGGGELRIGGEFQGGKGLPVDELPNAATVVATDATRLDASATDLDGAGGTAIVWSDRETVFLGEIDVTPGQASGAGGMAEISSAGLLTWRGRVATGRPGRSGQVLLDPKNIVVAAPSYSQYSLILGYNHSDLLPREQLATLDAFGTSVSLSGERLAVGAPGDDGPGDAVSGAGAVYLFHFDDSSYNGGVLKGVVGKGYTGGNNVDVAQLEANDEFGTGVALDGLNLAVGAPGDDGADNGVANAGAVYTFRFADAAMSGGVLTGRLGRGYAGADDVDMTAVLDANDHFGQAVALSGTSIAVGAPGDAGSLDALADGGAVYGFTSGTGLTGPVQQAVIGHGYTGGKNHDPGIQAGDRFGYGLSLDATRMAVGAIGDDGSGDSVTDSGAVYLFTFADTAFGTLTQVGTIGDGYTATEDVDIDLDTNDHFGKGLGIGTQRLLVGAPGDDGYLAAGASDYGAVRLVTFADGAFTGGAAAGVAGRNYAGVGDIDLSLTAGAGFGRGVGGDGTRWAAGLPGDGGASNPVTGAGAVMLFTGFTAATANEATIGRNYAGALDIDISRQPAAGDGFGAAVALQNLQLAVGAPFDDGAGDPGTAGSSGAVYLFTFADTAFAGGALKGIIGKGYVGGANIDIAALEADDQFGAAVSLDATRLAVGAPGDDGDGNATADGGAVYLFAFADNGFGGGTLQQSLGRKSVAVLTGDNVADLGVSDRFGGDVALNGNRLAVGAAGDDGPSNASIDSGAVRLYSLDTALTTVTAIATLGDGYAGGNNIDVPGLDAGDAFGSAVALEDTRLAVGASSAKTAANTGSNVGAVHLFTFTDSSLASGSQVGVIGSGNYAALGHTLNMGGLANDDYFGEAVALSGDTLAVGAPLDDGSSNTITNSGAVYLFDFADLAFGGPALRAVFGKDYSGGSHVNVAVEAGDLFGDSVSLNAGRMAVGASFADGDGNAAAESGAVYLFNTSNGTIGSQTFGSNPVDTVTLSTSALADLLSTPQTVILQASNDITFNEGFTVNNAAGDGGDLYLAAGRSVLLNRSITTDNGDLFIRANAPASDGVVDSQRDAGAAAVTMLDGYTINAGTGTVQIEIETGAGKTHAASGDITLATIVAGNVLVANRGLTAGSDILNAGSTPTITATTAAFSATGQVGSSGQPMAPNVARLAVASGGDVAVSSQQALSIGGAALGGLDGLAAGGNLTLSVQGQLAQTQPVSVAGTASITVTGAPLRLDHAGNDFQGAVTATATSGTVTINDQNALAFGGLTAHGTLTVTAGGGISQLSGLYVNAPASFTAAGAIVLANTGNYFGTTLSLASSADGSITVDAGSAIQLGSVDAAGSLTVLGTGPVTLSQDVTAVGNLSMTGGITTSADLDVVSETGAISLGAVTHGLHNLLLAGDTISLNGDWSGTGSRTIKPFHANRAVAIATTAPAAGALELSAVEIARLEAGSPSMVTIGRSDGSSALTSGTWSFDDNLTLAGGSIALSSSTLTKSAGSLSLVAAGAVTGAVNLAAGTGTLNIHADSVALTGTVNGVTGALAAGHVSFTGTGGSGPFTMNGTAFHTVARPPAAPAPVEEDDDAGEDEGGTDAPAPVDDGGTGPGDSGSGDSGSGDSGAGESGSGGSGAGGSGAGGTETGDTGASTGDPLDGATDPVPEPSEPVLVAQPDTGLSDETAATGSAAPGTTQAAGNLGAAEVEAVKTSAQITVSLDQTFAASNVTAGLTLAAMDTASGLSGSADGSKGQGDRRNGSSTSGAGGSGSSLPDEQPFDEQAQDPEEGQQDQGETPEEEEEEQAPRQQEEGYASNRYVEMVDVDAAAQSQDADDGGAGPGAGCSC